MLNVVSDDVVAQHQDCVIACHGCLESLPTPYGMRNVANSRSSNSCGMYALRMLMAHEKRSHEGHDDSADLWSQYWVPTIKRCSMFSQSIRIP